MIKTECVCHLYPDKMCDRISDTLLDLYLQGDPNSRVIETCGGNGKVFITGEVTSKTEVSDDDIKTIVHNISGVEDVTIHLNSQSPEISQGVDTGGSDQGIMIGYACNENDQYLPQEYFLSRELNKFIYGKFPYDGKTQVTMNGNSLRVVCSFQNAPSDRLQELVLQYFEDYPQYHIEHYIVIQQVIGISEGLLAMVCDSRKLADNYGPRVPIGGGIFSGKDATKVDRSLPYAKKNTVDLLEERNHLRYLYNCFSTAIGYDKPLQPSAIIDGEHESIKGYDLTPKGIIDFLELKTPIYSETA